MPIGVFWDVIRDPLTQKSGIVTRGREANTAESPLSRPLVGDPETIDLHRIQLRYRNRAIAVTAGRQRIGLDDERFVGTTAFRQNGQAFDAVRTEWAGVAGVKADVTYARSVRTPWGIDGDGVRQTAIDSDTMLGNLSFATPFGTLTGFAYLIDQDEAAVQSYRWSNQTYGARLAGSRAVSGVATLWYQLSYARQRDHHRNPADYAASYYLVDAALNVARWKLNAGYEVLGADRGVALASFQTPLGAVFKFQGWAGKFATTPPQGVRDLYAGATHTTKGVGAVEAIALQGVYHRFRSDRLDQRYGQELDLLASARIRHTTLSARYAHYQPDTFATDTDKAWLQLDWTY